MMRDYPALRRRLNASLDKAIAAKSEMELMVKLGKPIPKETILSMVDRIIESQKEIDAIQEEIYECELEVRIEHWKLAKMF